MTGNIKHQASIEEAIKHAQENLDWLTRDLMKTGARLEENPHDEVLRREYNIVSGSAVGYLNQYNFWASIKQNAQALGLWETEGDDKDEGDAKS